MRAADAGGAGIDELDEDACWTLLGQAPFGRIALRSVGGVDIFPVNFLVHDGGIFLRSGPGSKLIELTDDPRVAFEADGRDGGRMWSVVVSGEARRLGSDSEIEESGVLQLETLQPGEKFNYVRIAPDRITGRRFTPIS